ncbi:MAG: hypothetical protein WC797_04640 [Candidatus Paceibacterota bacterium]|jgi:hypothetical protein
MFLERPQIGEIKRLIQANLADILTSLMIVLVGIGGFGIGRLSMQENGNQDARILSASVAESGATYGGDSSVGQPTFEVPTLEEGGQVVASKSGTKYHAPWCSGAKSIKEENKIYFDTIEAARAARYTPAANCKGLK